MLTGAADFRLVLDIIDQMLDVPVPVLFQKANQLIVAEPIGFVLDCREVKRVDRLVTENRKKLRVDGAGHIITSFLVVFDLVKERILKDVVCILLSDAPDIQTVAT